MQAIALAILSVCSAGDHLLMVDSCYEPTRILCDRTLKRLGIATSYYSPDADITAFLRAPFTEYQGRGGPGEVEERPRGDGVRRGIGELLVCPYCLGLWASGAFHVGLLFAPRTTRVAASTLTALTMSDFLQIAYKAAEERGLGGS